MNNTMQILSETPFWYWIVATVVSLYHGYRGFTLQRILIKDQKESAAKPLANGAFTPTWKWSICNAILVRSLFDGIFYLFCSVVGFISLRALISIYNSITCLGQISVGSATILGILGVFSTIGIVGQLPYLILLGKLPK
jgi:hypothetical protein